MSSRLRLVVVLSITFLLISSSLFASPITESKASPATILNSDAGSISIGFDASMIEATDVEENGDKFQSIQIPEEGTTFDYGRPLLPAISRFVLIPPEAGIEFSYSYDAPRALRATAPPTVCNDSALMGGFVNELTSVYPGKLAEISEPFVVRGARLVKVTVFPVQYDPNNNSYSYYDNIVTTINYTDDEPINPVQVPARRHRSKLFREVIRELAINGDEFGRDDPRDSETPYVGHYLVVAPQPVFGFQKVRDWIEFRRRSGYKMELLVAQQPGSPQNTKSAIQAVYNSYVENGEDPFDYIALIGDENYDRPVDHQASNVLTPETGESIWGGGYPHADYKFALLEGNDQHPDVGYSRFPAGSDGAANLIFGRTLAYEETPRMANPEWFTRGANYSQHWGNSESSAWHISIHTNARWGEEVLKNKGFDDVFFYELTQWDQAGSQIGPRIAEQYNRGVNVMVGRAEIYYWQTNFQGVNGVNENNTDHAYPIDIVYSGHGEWALQVVYRSGTWPNQAKGPVARTACWGWPATAPLNYIWATMVNWVVQREMPLGIARAYSVISIEGIFPNINIPNVGGQLYSHIKTDTDMYGDPGLVPWIGIPRLAEINMPETIPPSTKSLEVFVHSPDSDDPLPGAQVTMYAPGNMPALNQPANYASYSDFIQKNAVADEDGFARFVLEGDEEFTINKPVCITASGRDIRPFTDTIRVANVTSAIELSNYELNQRAGNGDDVINPGDAFDLTITARNVGTSDDLADVTCEVTSVSPYLEVVENDFLQFGDIAQGDSAVGGADILIRFTNNTPDGESRPITRPILKLHFMSGEDSWDSQIKFMPMAPNFELQSIVGGNVIQTDVQDLNLDIKNVGSIDADRLNIELRSLGMGVSVVRNSAMLDDIRAGDHHRLEAPFLVSGNSVVVPGSKTPMVAVFTSDDGFVDSLFFDLQIGSERENAPTGPDEYGYICFDDTDTDWDMAPRYEWAEISTNANDNEYDGTRLQALEGNSEHDIGKCTVIDLGFTTQFYGKQYTQITVATNGFISMGAQPRITNYSNWPMDHAIAGGVGMLAPFWDDLRYGQNSAIWSFYDEENGRMIVEWERMRFANGGQNAELTFQVIILDKDVWITESGDPNIIFQYKTISNVSNIRNGDTEWVDNIAYSSVGISSPTGRAGINYAFKNTRPTSASVIENRRVLLFSTSPRYKSCALRGYVRDFQTGVPLEGVRVYTKQGFAAFTDADGYWQILDALAEVPFDITAFIPGYNDSTYLDQEVVEADTVEYIFDLLHPEFSPSTQELFDRLDPDRVRELHWSLFNGGNGPLYWSAEKRLLGDANAAPWELRRSYNIGELTQDDRIEGVIFAEDQFFFSGANGNEENLIYIVNRDGELTGSFPQVGSSRYGYKDMDWDGNFIWAAGEDSIYCLTTDGQVVNVWVDPLNPTQYITYDSDNNILYLSGTTTNIFKCDTNGQLLESVLDRKGLRIYGLGYWPEDPDGDKLYIVHKPQGVASFVTKMNTETGDTTTVAEIAQTEGATGEQSIWITNEFDVYSWVMMSIQNTSLDAGGDKLMIHQLDARKDWMDLDLWADTLDAQETQEFIMTFNTESLPDTVFEGELLFRHNAEGGETRIHLELDIIGPELPEPFDLVAPANGQVIQALPLHGDTLRMPGITFAWNPSYDWNAYDSIVTYLFTVTTGGQSFYQMTRDTSISLALDTLNLPLWFDAPVQWSVKAFAGNDSIECNDPFTFHISPDDIDRDKFGVPIEFGLHSIYPSPFNSITSIYFGADKAVPTTLRIYDIMGREVAVLFDRTPEVGNYKIAWNASGVATGIYMIRLESAGRTALQKVALIR